MLFFVLVVVSLSHAFGKREFRCRNEHQAEIRIRVFIQMMTDVQVSFNVLFKPMHTQNKPFTPNTQNYFSIK